MRTCPVIAVLGDLPADGQSLQHEADELGWTLEYVSSLDRLRDIYEKGDLVAVVFDPSALGMTGSHAIRLVLDVAPGVPAIVGHWFSDGIQWPALADAGAFHTLDLPLDPSEVRQSLGFVLADRCRRQANGSTSRDHQAPQPRLIPSLAA